MGGGIIRYLISVHDQLTGDLLSLILLSTYKSCLGQVTPVPVNASLARRNPQSAGHSSLFDPSRLFTQTWATSKK